MVGEDARPSSALGAGAECTWVKRAAVTSVAKMDFMLWDVLRLGGGALTSMSGVQPVLYSWSYSLTAVLRHEQRHTMLEIWNTRWTLLHS